MESPAVEPILEVGMIIPDGESIPEAGTEYFDDVLGPETGIEASVDDVIPEADIVAFDDISRDSLIAVHNSSAAPAWKRL